MSPPGLIVSAPCSGAGKSTVTLGLLRAFRDVGVTVQPFKSGPDYIDPGFHRAAAGRPSYNLDGWAMPAAMLDGLTRHADDADLVIAEGAMGLFDGTVAPGLCGNGASAGLARRMGWPVVLVVDVSGQGQSAAATAQGFARFDPDVKIAGVVLNRVASPRHARMVRAGMEAAGLPVFGCLPRSAALSLPERHLGLVQAGEHADIDARIAGCAAIVRDTIDLVALRAAAGGVVRPAAAPARATPPAQRIALARDAAFSFAYPHLLSSWAAAGATILPFSPLADEAPDATADLVWLPGGYPELHAGRLSAAGRFHGGLRAHAAAGRPIHGECGGYIVLGQALVDADGTTHPMAGLLGLVTSYAARRLHLGYRRARLLTPIGAMLAGTRLTGHEFHYSTIVAQPDEALADVVDADGAAVAEAGSRRGPVSGTFFHLIAEDA